MLFLKRLTIVSALFLSFLGYASTLDCPFDKFTSVDLKTIWPAIEWNGSTGFLKGLWGDTTKSKITISTAAAKALAEHRFPIKFFGHQVQISKPHELKIDLSGFEGNTLEIDVHDNNLVLKLNDVEKAGSPPIEKIFKVAALNSTRNFSGDLHKSTQAIRQTTAINGYKIENLEKVMRPDSMSQSGFLGQAESLVDVLASDNEFVIRSGLSHSDLAKPLKELHFLALAHGGGKFQTAIEGRQYEVTVASTVSSQASPFFDGVRSEIDMKIKNLATGESIQVSGLLPHLIEKYGFYEGFQSPYRVSPEELLSVFPFLKK